MILAILRAISAQKVQFQPLLSCKFTTCSSSLTLIPYAGTAFKPLTHLSFQTLSFDPLPTLHASFFSSNSSLHLIPFHPHEPIPPLSTLMPLSGASLFTSHLKQYFALKVLPIRDSLLATIFHATLASNAWLNEAISRIRSPPLVEEKFQFDDTGDGGNGNNKVGGGDNGGGGFGDDDDYFDFDDNEEDDGAQGGWFRRRIAFSELYNRVFIESVLNEWQKTLKDLPDGIRLACELGAMSSAQLVRYLMNEARPTITRAISRTVSKSMSAAFIGRITADPAFLHKLLFEQFVTVACSIRSEFKRRGERIRQEWDLALINVLTVAACNLVVVWSLAPCCSYEKVSRFRLQNTLHKLPNNMFETSYHHRRFDVYQRIQSFVCKAVQFSLVGFTAGAVQTVLSNLCAKNKEGRLSVQIPPANTNALGYGAFLGIYTNWRYQMLCGMDKVLTNHFEVIGVSLFLTAAFRILNAHLGDISRAAWLDTANFAPLLDKALNEKVKRKKRVVRN